MNKDVKSMLTTLVVVVAFIILTILVIRTSFEFEKKAEEKLRLIGQTHDIKSIYEDEDVQAKDEGVRTRVNDIPQVKDSLVEDYKRRERLKNPSVLLGNNLSIYSAVRYQQERIDELEARLDKIERKAFEKEKAK